MRSYSPHQASQFTGVGVPQIKRWADTSLIVPDHGGGGAKGKHRGYSFRNLFEIAVALECHKFQLPTDTMRRILAVVRDASMGYLTFDSNEAYAKYKPFKDFGSWEGWLLHPYRRPPVFTAVLQYFPGEVPQILSGAPSVPLASRPGYAFLIIPLSDLLTRLEIETRDRFDVPAMKELDKQRAVRAGHRPPGPTINGEPAATTDAPTATPEPTTADDNDGGADGE